MTDTGIIGLLIIIANTAFSYKGFTTQSFYDRYKFEVDKILIYRQYTRLISSGFLHVSWPHLIFNMFSLYFFSATLEFSLGEIGFLAVYFAGLLGGDLLSLYIHRNHPDYGSVGASGAIAGIIFASIALFPGSGIAFFGLPFSIPSWLYGIVFIAFSIYGIKSGKENIGHEAHLGGALAGMLVAIMMRPSALLQNYPTILIISLPTLAFIYLIITRPHILLVDNLYFKKHKNDYSVDHKYNKEKTTKQLEMDRLLDKINSKGLNSLSQKEKDTLKDYSRKLR